MNKLVFPLLNADDIEVRIGNFNQERTKCTLLLYQDARCGMKYLDQVVGAANWQKRYYEVRNLVICSLGININYDKPEKEPYWVFKDDTGSAGTIEEEKSIVSDSFKRCCVCFGLARELYTAPTIWVDNPKAYCDFQVKHIAYNKDKEITELIIIAKNKNKNYQVEQIYPKGKDTPKSTDNEPKNKGYFEPKDFKVGDTFLNNEKGSITDEQIKMIDTYVSGLTIVSHDNFFKRLDAVYGVGTINLLSEQQAQEIIDKIGGKK